MTTRKTQFKPKTETIYNHYPIFFWVTCCNCNSEFRRQHGYRAITGPFICGSGKFRSVCATCAPTLEAADAIFQKAPWVPKRPPPPKGGRPPAKRGQCDHEKEA